MKYKNLMATNFEQRTNEFIELFYEGEDKAPPYLSKQRNFNTLVIDEV